MTEKLSTLLKDCQGVILDFDGLIADSEPFQYRAYNEVFERYGHSLFMVELAAPNMISEVRHLSMAIPD